MPDPSYNLITAPYLVFLAAIADGVFKVYIDPREIISHTESVKTIDDGKGHQIQANTLDIHLSTRAVISVWDVKRTGSDEIIMARQHLEPGMKTLASVTISRNNSGRQAAAQAIREEGVKIDQQLSDERTTRQRQAIDDQTSAAVAAVFAKAGKAPQA